MTCEQFDRQLHAYLAGALSETDAAELEQHAATCTACEARLDQATRLTFTPPPVNVPHSLRADTLAAVALRRHRARSTRWWRAATAVAAVLVVAVTFKVRDSRVSMPPTVTSDQPALSEPDRLARDRSQTEFTALDAAARELEAALAKAPNDTELRTFLSSVQARRDELSRRVKAARS